MGTIHDVFVSTTIIPKTVEVVAEKDNNVLCAIITPHTIEFSISVHGNHVSVKMNKDDGIRWVLAVAEV